LLLSQPQFLMLKTLLLGFLIQSNCLSLSQKFLSGFDFGFWKGTGWFSLSQLRTRIKACSFEKSYFGISLWRQISLQIRDEFKLQVVEIFISSTFTSNKCHVIFFFTFLRLPNIISTYSNSKPTLIFTHSRKSTQMTASNLAQVISFPIAQ